MTLTTCNGAGL